MLPRWQHLCNLLKIVIEADARTVNQDEGHRLCPTGGQVKATKYVVFRNITASFFSGYVGNFHEKHQVSLVRIRCVGFLL